MPKGVIDTFGFALYLAQIGEKHDQAKPLHGSGSAGVIEITDSHRGNAYRAVYTVRFADAVYVLHCFQKKSSRGTQTPGPEMELVRERLTAARLYSESAQR